MDTGDVPEADKRMKRTSFSPWSLGKITSKPSTRPAPHRRAANEDAAGPEPARIVSDIVLQSTEDGAPSGSAGLSGHPKIAALQREWEDRRQAGGPSRSDSRTSSTGAGLQSPPGRVKSPSTGQENKAPPKGHSSFQPPQAGSNPKNALSVRPYVTDIPTSITNSLEKVKKSVAKDHARRFTEEAVQRQLAEITGQDRSEHLTPIDGKAKLGGRVKRLTEVKQSPTPELGDADVPHKPIITEPPTPKPSEDGYIVMADDHRPYTMYQAPDGRLDSGRGALFPVGYTLHHDPDLPYVCPVRDCRRLFQNLKAIGGHFSAGHRASKFNDNGDGTLTKVASYTKTSPGGGGTPGLIVSRNPLPADAPPMAEPGLPYQAQSQALKRRASSALEANRPKRHDTSSDAANDEETVGPNQLVDYLYKFLPPTQNVYKRPDIQAMLALPKRRDLPEPWIQCHRGNILDADKYSCALAYMTGREVLGPERCTFTASSHLSEPCIALAQNLPAATKKAFSAAKTCVGCRYLCVMQGHRGVNPCDWNTEGKEDGRASSSPPQSIDSDVMEVEYLDKSDTANPGAREAATKQPDVSGSNAAKVSVTEPLAIRKADGKSPITIDDVPGPFGPDTDMDRLEVKETRKQTRRRLRREAQEEQVRSAVTKQLMAENDASGAGGGASARIGLQMEDWEVAPGRMRSGDDSENIAYSNSYLSSGHPITVSEDVAFNVQVIKPGSSTFWDAEVNKLRTCSVATGKLKVTMGERSFHLGPNGMFVVRPGQTCKVENRIYMDATVHCTTMADFQLQQ